MRQILLLLLLFKLASIGIVLEISRDLLISFLDAVNCQLPPSSIFIPSSPFPSYLSSLPWSSCDLGCFGLCCLSLHFFLL